VPTNSRAIFDRITAIKFSAVQKNSGQKHQAAAAPESSHRSVMTTTRLNGKAGTEGIMSMRSWWSDARHFQIVALSSLLTINFIWIDFGAKPLYSALAISSALLTQIVCSRLSGLPNIDLRSPLITGLSLSLLLRANEPWLPAIAGFVAIASKFALRIDGRHIFNPAGFAIVVLLLTSGGVWISPGQWGTSLWLASLLVFFAILVLQAAQRSDIALFFLGSHAALLFARALWLGDPLAIPLHQLQSGSLLIFAFFMISDPKTTPDSRSARFLFAFTVAAAAHYLAFFMQMRPALYVALIALSPLTPLLNRIMPGKQFQWTRTMQGVAR
jgi:enediyne biosynthesis protein E5